MAFCFVLTSLFDQIILVYIWIWLKISFASLLPLRKFGVRGVHYSCFCDPLGKLGTPEIFRECCCVARKKANQE